MSYAYNKAKKAHRNKWQKRPKHGHGQGYHNFRPTPSQRFRALMEAFSRGVGRQQGTEVRQAEVGAATRDDSKP